MARRVFVHVGLPKTATTYLQTILWANRDLAREHGLLLPGRERRDHLWASRVVREEPERKRRPQREHDAWARIRGDLAGARTDALISHEFFGAASREQAVTMVEQLAPAEVHVVVTAREPLGLFTASWQESLKNRATTPIADYARRESRSPQSIWNWRSLDLRLVLKRWSAAVPPERIHVLPLDPGAPRDDIWHRFADLVGLPADQFDLSMSFPNQSMGVVEAELLRRVNGHLGDFRTAFDRGVYIRSFLADERLVSRGGERYWPPADQVEECRERGDRAIDFLGKRPFDVRGDVELLRVPAELPPRRTPDSVTDAEVADAATQVIATMLGDVRELRVASGWASGPDGAGDQDDEDEQDGQDDQDTGGGRAAGVTEGSKVRRLLGRTRRSGR